MGGLGESAGMEGRGQVESANGSFSIQAAGLTKHFGQVVAVDHVDLAVREGEFFGFLGPNGAGKSTTIRMLCGLLRPTGGAIHIAGYDLQREPLEVKRRLGVLPEEVNVYERLTGAEFLVFAARMHGLPAEEAQRRSDELIEVMELGEAQHKLIVDYSM